MNKTVQVLTILSNTALNEQYNLLEFKSETPLEGIVPGQFVNVLIEGTNQVFLRRPFSFFWVDHENCTFSILVKKVGPGTHFLANAQSGDRMSVLFPLGRGFQIPDEDSQTLLVGGGVGVAPLLMLAAELFKNNHKPDILLGGRSESDLLKRDSFGKYGIVHTTTEDGSHGVKGFVTNHSALGLDIRNYSKIYCCGPEPMMKAVASLARINGIACEVSLENTMACGYGVCLCCVTETTEGNKCVCTEGPVFDINRLKWQI